MSVISQKSDNEIISSNLTEVSDRQKKLNKLRISQAWEVLSNIKTILPHPGSAADAVSVISHYFTESGWLGRFSIRDKVLICRRLMEVLRESGYEPGELLFPAPAPSDNSVVSYVDNQFSAAAYDIFSSHISGAVPRKYSSFTEMCDSTASGETDACILPIENTSDGKLLSFYSLIDRSDLKISNICDVYSEDDSRRTRYALLRRSMRRPEGESGELYFEFSFCPTPGFTVAEILHAAVLTGLVVYRIDSVPLKYNESNFIFHPVLLGNIDDILVYTLFLALNSAQYTPVGLCSLMT
jgi:hypothetical protein